LAFPMVAATQRGVSPFRVFCIGVDVRMVQQNFNNLWFVMAAGDMKDRVPTILPGEIEAVIGLLLEEIHH